MGQVLCCNSVQPYDAVLECGISQFHAQGLVWDEQSQCLLWNDTLSKAIVSFNPITKQIQRISTLEAVGSFLPLSYCDDGELHLVATTPGTCGRLILSLGMGSSCVTGEAMWSPVQGSPSGPASREFPALIAWDRQGRLVMGGCNISLCVDPSKTSMRGIYCHIGGGEALGKWVLVTETSYIEHVTGMAWSLDGATMYLSDANEGCVVALAYNRRKAIAYAARVFFSMEADGPGCPAGLAVDHTDHLWVALYGGGKVVRLTQSGESVDQCVRLPSAYPTSMCFGGSLLATLYVTTTPKPNPRGAQTTEDEAPAQEADLLRKELQVEAYREVVQKEKADDLWCFKKEAELFARARSTARQVEHMVEDGCEGEDATCVMFPWSPSRPSCDDILEENLNKLYQQELKAANEVKAAAAPLSTPFDFHGGLFKVQVEGVCGVPSGTSSLNQLLFSGLPLPSHTVCGGMLTSIEESTKSLSTTPCDSSVDFYQAYELYKVDQASENAAYWLDISASSSKNPKHGESRAQDECKGKDTLAAVPGQSLKSSLCLPSKQKIVTLNKIFPSANGLTPSQCNVLYYK